MSKKTFTNKERVALKENTTWRGYVHSVMAPYGSGDVTMYNVQWDKSGLFLYLGDALISEADAIKLEAEAKAENERKLALEEKFKSMEKETAK